MLPPNAPVRADELHVIRGPTNSWRMLRGAALGALLAGSAVAAFALVEQPLVLEGLTVHARPAPRRADPGRPSAEYRHGEEIEYVVSLANRGRFGVTVTEVAPAPADEPSVLIRSAAFLVTPSPGEPVVGVEQRPEPFRGGLVRFRPFALRPGQRALVLVRARFASCRRLGHRDAAHARELVRFRTFGLGREAVLRLPAPIVVPDPLGSVGCPFRPQGSASATAKVDTAA